MHFIETGYKLQSDFDQEDSEEDASTVIEILFPDVSSPETQVFYSVSVR